MMNLMTTQPALTSYADKINQQFSKQQSHYVNLKQRLRSVVDNETYLQSVLEDSIEDFKERNPQYTKWTDITLASAQSTTLDKIAIDVTLQRLLAFYWAMGILDQFWAIQAEPIRVYEDPGCPGKYVCWDGQHTAIVLFIIASMVMNEDISNCEVPIVIYPSSQKDEMRRVFMAANGEGKRPLDAIDKYQQMVFGVRTDGSTIPNWIVAEQKQQWLESAKMFATHEKFNDTEMPGALTRMQELMDTRNYTPVITKYFTQYFTAVCRSNRPVQSKEAWMLYEFFKLCELDSNIDVTDKYIRDVAKALKVVGHGDFDSLDLWSRAKSSYQDYYRDTVRNGWDLLGIRYPEKPLGNTFLIAQIAKAGVAVPYYSETYYTVPTADLF
jgi:hypothetical protein